jgi:hypothetical protein
VCNTCGHHYEANHLCRKYPMTSLTIRCSSLFEYI